jgi:hypothetical protein
VSAQQAYISQTTFVAQFEPDLSIRFKLGEIERAFQGVCATQGVSTNVPDSAPKAIPRFTLQSGPKAIAVSQVTAQLDMDFTEQKKSLKNTFDIVQKNVELFWAGVKSFKQISEIKHAGLVLTIASPSQLQKTQICAKILEKYAKVPNRGAPATSTIQFGYLDAEHHLFNNIAISDYELRAGSIEMSPTNRRIEIDASSLPLREQGFETKLDFNSRPMAANQLPTPPDLAQILVENVRACAFEWGAEFIQW